MNFDEMSNVKAWTMFLVFCIAFWLFVGGAVIKIVDIINKLSEIAKL